MSSGAGAPLVLAAASEEDAAFQPAEQPGHMKDGVVAGSMRTALRLHCGQNAPLTAATSTQPVDFDGLASSAAEDAQACKASSIVLPLYAHVNVTQRSHLSSLAHSFRVQPLTWQ